jgi:hypothetical protein
MGFGVQNFKNFGVQNFKNFGVQNFKNCKKMKNIKKICFDVFFTIKMYYCVNLQ